MKAQGDFSPMNAGENEVLGFDFAKDLPEGDSVTGVIPWVAVTVSGLDPNPQAIVSGPATQDGTVSNQRIANPVAGTLYALQATVTTFLNNTLILWAYLPCPPVGSTQIPGSC